MLDLVGLLADNSSCRMPQKRNTKNKKLKRKDLRDLDVKITFLEGIVRRDPQFVDALKVLGDHYSQRGRTEGSLKVDQQLSTLEPANPLVFYNLACSYALNGDLILALSSLDKAISLGYQDFKWMSKDPDLTPVRKHPLYVGIKAKIRKLQLGDGPLTGI
jgi:tetratricopeptide (TPR) repeat protein